MPLFTSEEKEDSDDIIKLKVVLVGETHGGKTSLALRFCRDTFNTHLDRTIGAAFQKKSLTIANKKVLVNIWDTGGEERYQCIAPIYYRNADGAIVVYDITNKYSFEKARNWVEEIRRSCNTDPVIVLAGNKVDLEEQRKVPHQLAKKFAGEENLTLYETSAKNNINVNDAFMFIVQKAAENASPSRGGIQLDDSIKQAPPGRGCWC